jgi:hypothetical protein
MQLPEDRARTGWAGHGDNQLAVNREEGRQSSMSEIRRVSALAGRRLTVRDRRGAVECRMRAWPDARVAGCFTAIGTARDGEPEHKSDAPKRYPLQHRSIQL